MSLEQGRFSLSEELAFEIGSKTGACPAWLIRNDRSPQKKDYIAEQLKELRQICLNNSEETLSRISIKFEKFLVELRRYLKEK